MRTLARLSWVELKLFLREPLTVVSSLALPLIILFVLGGVFGNEPSRPGEEIVYRGVGPMSYYVPAYVALVVASVCVISIPTHLAGNRERGVLKRFHASSVPAWTVAGAEVAVAFALSLVSALILLLVASLAYDFEWAASIPAVLGVFVLLVLGFAALGIFLGAILPTARSAQAVGMLAWFVMLFLGGAGRLARPGRRALLADLRRDRGGERGARPPLLPVGVIIVPTRLRSRKSDRNRDPGLTACPGLP